MMPMMKKKSWLRICIWFSAFFLYFMVLMEVVVWDMAVVVDSRNLSKVISDL